MRGAAHRSLLAATVALCLLLASCSSSAGGESTPTNPSVTSPPAAPTGTAARPGSGPICGGVAADPSTHSMRTAFISDRNQHREPSPT